MEWVPHTSMHNALASSGVTSLYPACVNTVPLSMGALRSLAGQASAYAREIDYARMREIADSCGDPSHQGLMLVSLHLHIHLL